MPGRARRTTGRDRTGRACERLRTGVGADARQLHVEDGVGPVVKMIVVMSRCSGGSAIVQSAWIVYIAERRPGGRSPCDRGRRPRPPNASGQAMPMARRSAETDSCFGQPAVAPGAQMPGRLRLVDDHQSALGLYSARPPGRLVLPVERAVVLGTRRRDEQRGRRPRDTIGEAARSGSAGSVEAGERGPHSHRAQVARLVGIGEERHRATWRREDSGVARPAQSRRTPTVLHAIDAGTPAPRVSRVGNNLGQHSFEPVATQAASRRGAAPLGWRVRVAA